MAPNTTHAYTKKLTHLTLEQLLQLKVTTSKYEEVKREATGTVYIISETDIKLRGYRDLKDVLNDLPGVGYTGNSGNVEMTFVRVRGIVGNSKIPVFKDGIQLNNPSGTPLTWGNNIPLHDIEQIEIVIGPASVIYGRDTYSGLINLKSKKTPYKKVQIGAGSYQTIDPAFVVSHENSLGRFFLSGRGFYSEGQNRYEEYPDLYTTPVDNWKTKIPDWQQRFDKEDMETNARVRDYNIHAEYQWKQFTIGGMINELKEVNSLPHNPEHYFVNHLSPIQTRQYHGFAQFITTISSIIESKTILTYMQELRGEDYGFNYIDFPTDMPGRKKFFNSYDTSLKLEQQLIYHYSHNVIFNFGGTAEDITAVPQSANYDTQINPRDRITEDSYNFQNYGLFAQGSWKPLDWIKMVAGGRMDYNTHYKETFTPRLALIFTPLQQLTIKAMHGQAYLAPSIKDMYFVNPTSTAITIKNPKLKPQLISTEEFSIHYQLSESISATTNLFYNKASEIVKIFLIDVIDSTETSVTDSIGFETWQYRNVESQTSYGGDFILDAVLLNNKLKLRAWYSFLTGTESKYNSDNNSFSDDALIQISSHKGNLGITYLPTTHIGIHCNTHYTGEIKTNTSNTLYQGEKLSDVYDVDLHLSIYEIIAGVELSLKIENVLNNKQYHVEERGDSWRIPHVPQPLRNYMINVIYSF
ncbi:MAG: TonB-dependent receptor [Fibrobacterales bacterium]